MTPVQRVLAIARSENGYLEKATNAQLEDKTANAGYNNWNKFAAFPGRSRGRLQRQEEWLRLVRLLRRLLLYLHLRP